MENLIRLLLIKSDITEREITKENLSEIYCIDKVDGVTFPLTYLIIDKYQHKDKEMLDKLRREKYHTKYFCGVRKVIQLICISGKFVVPTIIQK